MPEITANTPTKGITIKGIPDIQVHVPFEEGMTYTDREADVQNQTRCENVRNNKAAEIEEMIEEAGGVDKVDRDAVQALVTEYSLKYEFGLTPGGGFRTTDPLEAAKMEVAKGAVKDAIRASDAKLSDFKASEITAMAKEAIDNPQYKDAITQAAEALVEERKRAAERVGKLSLSL